MNDSKAILKGIVVDNFPELKKEKSNEQSDQQNPNTKQNKYK